MATAKKREEQPIEEKRPWGPVKEDLCRIWRETFDHLWSFSTINNLLDRLSPFKISEKLPGCQYSMNFHQHFFGILFIYSLCWFVIYSLLCPGVGVLSHVPCPMSHVPCRVFLKNVLALPLSIGTCSGLGMLGIDCIKRKISLVGFYCCCFCYLFAPLALLVLDICCWEGRGLGLGVNIVKCRNYATT